MSNFDCDKFDQIEKNLEDLFIPKYYPGYVLSIYENGTESYFSKKGYDDIYNKIEYKKNSIFRIYSMTKPIVSTAVMQLIENNIISLNDEASKYIPEWKYLNFNNSKNKNTMTIKDLLTHTSGLTYGFQGQSKIDNEYKVRNINAIVDSELTSQEIINELSEIPLEFAPGNFYNYSISIDILGYIIERVSNLSLEEYLTKNIFNKLDMHDTSFILEEKNEDRLVKCYRWNESNKSYQLHHEKPDPNIKVKSYKDDPKSFSGGAGLISTISDYQQFGSAILDAKKGRKNPILKKDTAELMMKNHLPKKKFIDEFSKYPLIGGEYYKGIGFGLGGSICVN